MISSVLNANKNVHKKWYKQMNGCAISFKYFLEGDLHLSQPIVQKGTHML